MELTGDCVKTELFGYIAVLCKVMFTKFMNVQYTCFKPDATGLVKRYIGTGTFESKCNIYSAKGKEN